MEIGNLTTGIPARNPCYSSPPSAEFMGDPFDRNEASALTSDLDGMVVPRSNSHDFVCLLP